MSTLHQLQILNRALLASKILMLLPHLVQQSSYSNVLKFCKRITCTILSNRKERLVIQEEQFWYNDTGWLFWMTTCHDISTANMSSDTLAKDLGFPASGAALTGASQEAWSARPWQDICCGGRRFFLDSKSQPKPWSEQWTLPQILAADNLEVKVDKRIHTWSMT